MKKKIVVGIIIIILGLICFIGYYISKDMNQEEVLQKEVSDVLSFFDDLSNINTSKINDKLNRTVTKGDYAKVEIAFKKYIHDYIYDLDIIKIINTINDENLFSSLSIKNYKEDGPKFINTKKYLKDNISFLETSKEKYIMYLEDEKIMSYLDDDLNEYYKSLYRNELISEIKDENSKKDFADSIDKIINILKNSQKIINLLSSNENAWKIDNDQIIFSSESIMTEYNNLFNLFNV